jgi:hypothetical protein
LHFSEIKWFRGHFERTTYTHALDRMLNLVDTSVTTGPWRVHPTIHLLVEVWYFAMGDAKLLHLIGCPGETEWNPIPEMKPRRCQPYLQCQPRRRETTQRRPVMGKLFWEGAKEKRKNFRRANVNY